jgi:hypothetical protein
VVWGARGRGLSPSVPIDAQGCPIDAQGGPHRWPMGNAYFPGFCIDGQCVRVCMGGPFGNRQAWPAALATTPSRLGGEAKWGQERRCGRRHSFRFFFVSKCRRALFLVPLP